MPLRRFIKRRRYDFPFNMPLHIRNLFRPFINQKDNQNYIRQEVARQLAVRFIFTEKEDGKLVLRRGFKIASGEKILVVEDVVTKGGRVQETLDIVRAHKGRVAGVGVVVDRSGGRVDLGVPAQSLVRLEVETFDPARCPLCKQHLPLQHPGSK